jgi:hypothetical protein
MSDGGGAAGSTATTPRATATTAATPRSMPTATWDRADPSLAGLLLVDPTSDVGAGARRLLQLHLRSRSRRVLKPFVRLVSLVVVMLITALKRVLPFEVSWHDGIDGLCIWFMRRFVAPEACAMLMRHFVIETNLLCFLARNARPGQTNDDGALEEPTLRPRRCADLGDRAVIRHDLNVYNLLHDLGVTPGVDVRTPRPLHTLDVSMLDAGPIEGDDGHDPHRRFLNLDIETSLYLMNIPFCLFTTTAEYERGVNSFQLDQSLCAALAGITGDATFASWTPLKFAAYVTTWRDVPRDLYWHAAVDELAHGRLKRLVLEAKARHAQSSSPTTTNGASSSPERP